MTEMKETPRSSATSVDISAIGITGQEDTYTANNNDNNKETTDTPSIRGNNKTVKMILLTQCLAGSVSNFGSFISRTPYLLSLGLSKSLMSLVWLAGPLSGLIMQPIVGSLSDNSTSRFGRRRPFLLAGSFAVVGAFMCIGWTREIVGLFFGKESSTANLLSKCLAVMSFYILDFAINCVQASCRVLIVDVLPPSQQEEGTAWAGRMVGIGSVAGYFMGFINLVEIFPFLGKTQLQVFCVIASIVLLASDVLTCWAVTEQIYTAESNKSTSAFTAACKTLSSIIKSFRNLPRYIQLICNVQFFSWIGWFPFLFYATTWVAEIHSRYSNDSPEKPSDDSVGDSTRAGSLSLLLYSIVSLAASFALPFLVSSAGANTTTRPKFSWKQLPFAFLTVPKLWTISHFIFAFSMLSTWFVTNGIQANIVTSVCGIAWAIVMWAPFSLLGEYISKESRTFRSSEQRGDVENTDQLMYNLVETGIILEGGDNDSENNDENVTREEHTSELPFIDSSHDGISANDSSEAGVLLGIHNMYVVLPQFLVTFISSIIFAILEPGEPGDNNNVKRQHQPHDKNLNADSIGFMLRFGGLMAIVAGILSLKLWK